MWLSPFVLSPFGVVTVQVVTFEFYQSGLPGPFGAGDVYLRRFRIFARNANVPKNS